MQPYDGGDGGPPGVRPSMILSSIKVVPEYTLIAPDVTPEALEPSAACQHIPASNAASVMASDNWLPAWVPQGFTLQSESSDQVAGSSSPVLSRTYTDGLTRFSLFVEPLDASQQAENVRAQLGPTVAVSRKLSTTDGTILATLVGEIPVATAEQIVASLAPATPGTAQ